MPAPSLPSRDEFLERNITFHINHDQNTECAICYEKFDADEHVPLGFRGAGTCEHVFGASCIYTWLVSGQSGANTCPLCRTVLFQQEETNSTEDGESEVESEEDEEDEEDQYLGARPSDNLHTYHPANLMIDLTNSRYATRFLIHLWKNLEKLAFSEWVPHEEEIEACILKAAEKMRVGYIVRRADLPQFLGLAKKIMRHQAKLGEGFELRGEELWKWIDRMKMAGLWSVCSDEQ